MIKKKDPAQKIVEDDFSDDDPIIELTDEVIIKPEEDRKVVSPKTTDFIPSKVDKDPSYGDDEGFIVFEENSKSSLHNDPFIEAEGQNADDDVFIMDNGRDEVDGDSTAIINDDAIEMTGDEIQKNFDEEIELEYESDGEEIDFFAGDDERTEDNDVLAMPSEASPTFGEDDNGIDMPADSEFEREAGEEIIPPAEMDKVDVETDEDIIEITKFDQHFPDDDEVSEHAGRLDPSGLEDEDFLELFDIEEEGPMDDEEMRELSESEEKAVEAELSRFFDDALEDETAIENNTPQPVKKFSKLDTDLDLAMTAAALSSGPGKIDRPDTPFPQDPTNKKERASLPKDQSEKDDPMQKDSLASNAGDSPVVSPEQIDQAIERIINKKLAGRIEHIIYEIIEKTVKREIDRLKASLLEDSTPEDSP